MDESQIYEKLITILKRHTKYPDLLMNATWEAHIVNDLRVSSIRLVDVFLECEEEYGILINDDEIDGLRTIREVVKAIKMKISKK